MASENEPGTYRLPAIPEKLTRGVDPLNFAEWPIASFSSNGTDRSGTLTFEDEVPDPLHPGKTVTRRLVIVPLSETDPLGPLTTDDDWILFGLFQLTKLQAFPQELHFTRYQLLKLLGWQTNARDYKKLHDGLLRLQGHQFRFYNGFFDALAKSFITGSFNLYQNLRIVEAENSTTRPKPNPHQETFVFACSHLRWDDAVYEQFINRGVKGINFDFAKSLKRPLTRRIFRYLDKNFYFKEELTYDLETFVSAHCGLAPGQEYRDLKKTLAPALAELEVLGFLKAIPEAERYIKLRRSENEMTDGVRRFKYQIVLKKGDVRIPEEPPEQTESLSRARLLVSRGISEDQAQKLVRAYPLSIIIHQVQVVDWMEERGLQFKISKAAYLRDRIVNYKDRPDPTGYIPRAQREAMLEAKKKAQDTIVRAKEEKEMASQKAKEDFEVNFSAWWDALGEQGRAAVDASILARDHDDITMGYLNSPTQSEASKSIWKGWRVRVFCVETGVKPWGEG